MMTGHILKASFILGLSWQLTQAIAQAGMAPKNLSAQGTSDCLPPPDGLVSWWPGENNVADIVNGGTGALRYEATYAPGIVGQAFSVAGGSYVEIPDSASVNFSGTQSMTIELWANCTRFGSPMHIATKRNGVMDFEYQIAFDTTVGFEFSGSTGYQEWMAASRIVPQTNTWYHLAGTADGTTVKIYVNGELAGSTTGSLGPLNNAPLTLGALGYQGSPYPFEGLIDEVGLYNRALSPEEIRAIYQAGSSGKCNTPIPPSIISEPQSLAINSGAEAQFTVIAAGTGPLAYQWQFNSQSLENATNSTLHLSNVQPANAGTYTVIVVNDAGFASSTGAVLTVMTYPPAITVQPKSSTKVTAGTPFNLAVLATGTSPLSYQWQFNGTPLAGETNNTFKLAAAQPINAGIYTVMITNLYGAITSSNAVLQVTTDAPTIITQPQGRQLVTGNAFTLGATATGSRPLAFQWRLNGENLLNATNSSYSVSSSTSQSTGNYDLVVTNLYGAVTSRVATILIIQPPAIATQPISLKVDAGATVSFTVTAIGDSPLTYQWFFQGEALLNQTNASLSLTGVTVQQNGAYAVSVSNPYGSVTSDNAILEVTGDCIAAPSGLVAWWRAESNVVNQLSGNQGELKNGAIFAEGKVGQAFSLTNGAYVEIPNSSDVDFSGTQAITLETWVYRTGTGGMHILSKRIGAGDMSYQLAFDSHWGIHFATGPTWNNKFAYSSTTLPMNTWYHLAATADGSTLKLYTNGVLAGSVSGTLGPQNSEPLRIGTVDSYPAYPFVGLIDEVSIFNRALSADEIKAIYQAGGAGKCSAIAPNIVSHPQNLDLESGSNGTFKVTATGSFPLTYQWQFGGTNLIGETNAMLMLTNVRTSHAGTYSVVVANEYGYVTSTGAVLNVTGKAPKFTWISSSLLIGTGSNAYFFAYATGSEPLQYQWQFNGTNLLGATNSVLQITNAQPSQAGNYTLTVANDFGSITSTNLTLSLIPLPSQVRLENSVASNNTVLVPLTLYAQGSENAISCSLQFNSSLLKFSGITLAAGMEDLSLLANTNYVTNGLLGFALALPTAATFPEGTQQLVYVAFNVTPHTNAINTTISFANQPMACKVISALATTLTANYINAVVTLPFAGYEGDVAPLVSGGDNQINIQDWVEVGRLVAGLDLATNAAVFQRADCSPRATGGNGILTVADWVQTGRYAASLDPMTEATGPTAPPAGALPPAAWGKTGGSTSRALSFTTATVSAGQTQTVTVQLNAQGDENGLEFSVAYDPTVMSFAKAASGAGSVNAQLIVNTNQAAKGLIGLVLALPTGTTFAPNTQEVINLTFTMSANAVGHTKLVFTNSPLPQQVVDTEAGDLEATYQGSAFAIVPAAGNPSLGVTASNGQLSFSWPAWAAGYVIEANTNLNQNTWTLLPGTISTNGESVNLQLPISPEEPQRYYRLRYP